MLIVHALITFDLPYVNSLKGRRKVLHAIKDRLKNQNMAVADLSGEYPKEARIALCFFAKGQEDANNKIQKLEEQLQHHFPELESQIQYEIL